MCDKTNCAALFFNLMILQSHLMSQLLYSSTVRKMKLTAPNEQNNYTDLAVKLTFIALRPDIALANCITSMLQ